MSKPKRLALLITSGGTTMAAILEACRTGPLQGLIEPVLVISNKHDAGGLTKARTAGLTEDDIEVCDPRTFFCPEDFGTSLLCHLANRGVDLIGQYGWLPLTPVNVVKAFPGQIINQHPGPLDYGHPDFGGKGMFGRRVHCARLLYARETKDPADLWTEAVSHYVTEQYDQGAVIASRRIEIAPEDDTYSLQAKVLPVEHEVQIKALELMARGLVRPRISLDRPLVPPERYELLAECKRIASLLFPNG